MKNYRILLAVIISLILPTSVWAAGSCAYVSMTSVPNLKTSTQMYRYACTAGALGAMAGTIDVAPMAGHTCTKWSTSPGSTGMKDDSDWSMVTAKGITIVAAAAFGLNTIDNAAANWNYFEGPAADGSANATYEPITDDDITATVSNNDVVGGIVLIDFYCYPQ